VGSGGYENGHLESAPLAGQVPFTDLQARVAGTEMILEAFTPDEVNKWSGKDLDILVTHVSSHLRDLLPVGPGAQLPFSRVTAYGILRTQGVPLGKRDYEGQIRMRSA
jgi:uncharacterized protein